MDGHRTASHRHEAKKVPPYRVECVESKIKHTRLHYSRFLLTPLEERHAKTIDILLRRTLLGGIEGTAFTSVCFENREIRDECTAIEGLYETVGVVLDNLRGVVLRGIPTGSQHAFAHKTGPAILTAGDIQLPPGVECVDPDQLIATLVQPIELKLRISVERGKNYENQQVEPQDATSLPIDPVFMPVSRVDSKLCEVPSSRLLDTNVLHASNPPYGLQPHPDNHLLPSSHQPFGRKHTAFYMLFLEVETNGSVSPQHALEQASHIITELMRPLCPQAPASQQA
uniref:RNA polymerase alpha subunit n=1 Tax=Hormidiella parvula TaxID=2058785 RepID=UPI00286CF195|nr:RNA polymerase alpha subunit [Hormidiella parvula]WKT05982.1 RNA polymerase alpha subunit [Hormidiella parvula]